MMTKQTEQNEFVGEAGMRAALRMAIEALETAEIQSEYDGLSDMIFKAIDACKAALQEDVLDRIAENASELGLEWEGEQEPVAWMYQREDGAGVLNYERNFALMDKGYKEVPLYTRPTKPLTDDEIERLADAITIKWHIYDFDMVRFARKIEKAHGIGVKDE